MTILEQLAGYARERTEQAKSRNDRLKTLKQQALFTAERKFCI